MSSRRRQQPVSYTHLDVYKRQKVQIAYNVPKEITIYPGDKICYQLNMGDSGSVMYGQDNVPIILDGTDRVIGHFTISKSGMITVGYSSDWLTNDGEIPGRNNISTVLEASGELNFTDSGDEDHKKYIYIGDIKLEFKVKDKAKKTAIHVEKTVDYKNSDRQVTDAEGNVYPVSYTHLDVYKRQVYRGRRTGFR